jgi:hypothetical protein
MLETMSTKENSFSVDGTFVINIKEIIINRLQIRVPSMRREICFEKLNIKSWKFTDAFAGNI